MRTKNDSPVREQPTFIEAARRAQIIGAAIETIAELGFMNASLAQIAKRANISKGVIGYYFNSKEDLVRQTVDHFYATGNAAMIAQIGNVPTPGEMLRLYISSNIEYIDKDRTGTRAMGEIVANFRGADGQRVFTTKDEEPLIQATQALFDWGQKTGEFRAFDTRVMAVTLRRAIDGFAEQLQAHEDLDIPNYIAELTEMFVTATRNPAPPKAPTRKSGGSKS